MTSLAELSAGSPYQAYAYAYPHKTAYRPLDPPVPLCDAWAAEDKSALFLYVHVPFCEMRCGFCNLFTLAHEADEPMGRYLDALEREARAVNDALGPDRRFVRFAIGGGTPTYLPAAELARLFELARDVLGVELARIPVGVEVSPATADDARLDVLARFGVDRVSIGVQSFDENEAKALGRPQSKSAVIAALGRIRERRFATLNIDLIYGAVGQSMASWLRSIDEALSFEPEELYLYPLYVRQLTGLGKRGSSAADGRLAAYRAGRDHLLSSGYEQVSMRMFRRRRSVVDDSPAYACQRDGMVGLGPGARSYTARLHYATEYAVGRSGVRRIVDAYCDRDDFSVVGHGFVLDAEERSRRYAIQSVLQGEGLDRGAFVAALGTDPFDALPQLSELAESELAAMRGDVLTLTPRGLELSDVIGPWLASGDVNRRMDDYAWR